MLNICCAWSCLFCAFDRLLWHFGYPVPVYYGWVWSHWCKLSKKISTYFVHADFPILMRTSLANDISSLLRASPLLFNSLIKFFAHRLIFFEAVANPHVQVIKKIIIAFSFTDSLFVLESFRKLQLMNFLYWPSFPLSGLSLFHKFVHQSVYSNIASVIVCLFLKRSYTSIFDSEWLGWALVNVFFRAFSNRTHSFTFLG